MNDLNPLYKVVEDEFDFNDWLDDDTDTEIHEDDLDIVVLSFIRPHFEMIWSTFKLSNSFLDFYLLINGYELIEKNFLF